MNKKCHLVISRCTRIHAQRLRGREAGEDACLPLQIHKLRRSISRGRANACGVERRERQSLMYEVASATSSVGTRQSLPSLRLIDYRLLPSSLTLSSGARVSRTRDADTRRRESREMIAQGVRWFRWDPLPRDRGCRLSTSKLPCHPEQLLPNSRNGAA